MAFWNIDTTTRDGAAGAAHNGGIASFVAAGLSVLGVGLLVMTQASASSAELAGGIIAVAIECAVFLVAGFRLRAGKGLIWGGFAAALLVVEVLAKLATLTGLPGLVVNIILLIVIANGVRGAWTLRSGRLDGDTIGEVFE
ncbi:MAG: hypothetical protein V4537_04210 [Pseudomonadota bacterium]